jgi:hypothetical protein
LLADNQAPFCLREDLQQGFQWPIFSSVRQVQHEDATFARNRQYYYYLVIHLDAVEKPVEIDKAGPQFVVAKKLVARQSRAANNPFEAAPDAAASGLFEVEE